MLANLRALFGVVVDIVLLRRGPEHLPASRSLLVVSFVLSAVASSVMGMALGLSVFAALLQATVGAVIMLLWYQIGLSLAGKRERLPQTMTAMYLVNALFMPLMVPLISAMLPYMAQAQKSDAAVAPPGGLMLAVAVIGIWAIAVEVRIVKAAFEIPWLAGLLIVFGEFFAAGVLGMLLFGEPAKPA
jgi:hypothetical protein